ncbi:MAG: DUF134 domain-containing protein [Patescibacteria group bacterium]
MPRPRLCRRIRFCPRAHYFKPRGVPLRWLETVDLSLEETEALRLKHILDLDQVDCAKKMQTSQSTFQRILASAHKKIATALIKGRAIRIEE